MIKVRVASVMAAAVALLGSGLAANAVNSSVWIASTGADNAVCDRATPCKTLSAALTAVDNEGTIACADNVFLNESAFINKSVTIDCTGTNSQLFAHADAVTINAAGKYVNLRGFSIVGTASFGPTSGVLVQAAATVEIDRIRIHGIAHGSSGGDGILVANAGATRVTVVNSDISNNGAGSAGAGIRIIPQSGGSAYVSVERSVLSANTYGLAVDTTGGGAGVNVLLAESLISASKLDGIITVANPGPIGVTVDLTRAADNGQFGIRSFGAASAIRVARSTMTGNGTGVAAQNGGQLLTSGSNVLIGNGSDGAFTGPFGTQ